VAPGNDVTFYSNGAMSSGITHTPGTAPIMVNTAGTYAVIFSVTAVAANQFALSLNGASTVGGSTYSSETDLQDNGQVIVNLAAGDFITLRNTSLVSIPLPLGATNASVLILRVA
jgi:hypothetical protein